MQTRTKRICVGYALVILDALQTINEYLLIWPFQKLYWAGRTWFEWSLNKAVYRERGTSSSPSLFPSNNRKQWFCAELLQVFFAIYLWKMALVWCYSCSFRFPYSFNSLLSLSFTGSLASSSFPVPVYDTAFDNHVWYFVPFWAENQHG